VLTTAQMAPKVENLLNELKRTRLTCVRGHCKHGRDESFFARAVVVLAFYLPGLIRDFLYGVDSEVDPECSA
jgi:hypothetical protein